MKAKIISSDSKITVYEHMDELSETGKKAMLKAIDMLDKAYAPYSNFKVGAAAVTETGTIFPGCNQENASYPLCICGERVALYNAGAYEHDIPVKLLAIVCRSADKKIEQPVSPCGACRQVITEFEERHGNRIQVLLKGDSLSLIHI